MSTDTTDTTTDEPDEPDTTTDTVDTTTDEPDTWTPPDKDTFEKLTARADKRDKLLREAQAKIKKLESPDTKDTEPDKVALADARLIKASAKAALATAGVTDKDEQSAVLAVLNLSDVEVAEDGEVDEDAITERIGELRRIFGGKVTKRPTPRLDARDKGGSGGAPVSNDSARRRRFLTGA